jgi:hypothetical protein
MKKHHFNILFPLLPGLLLASALQAQTPFYSHYTTCDGLIQYSVSSIVQDDAGYMWFGTELGVSRFDGREFCNFTNANGFVNDAVRAIACASGSVYAPSGQRKLFASRWGRMAAVPDTGRRWNSSSPAGATRSGCSTRTGWLHWGGMAVALPGLVREARIHAPVSGRFGKGLAFAVGRSLWSFDEQTPPQWLGQVEEPIIDMAPAANGGLAPVTATRRLARST